VEARLLTEFGATFTAADHLARTDMLIWRGLTGEATRMVHRVPEDERPLAKARIALRAEANGVDAAIARVPAWQQADPRLVFERVRWRRRHNLTETAIELLRTNPDQTGPATAWWDERSILARRSMGDGAWANAYELVHAHGQTRRGAVAEAEWLAGWIALRHLDDVEAAYIHFARGQAVVTTPVSLARAEYWSARAAEALEALEVAQSRYEEAAQYPTTFYGQLAMEALAEGPMLALPADPQPNIVEADRLAEHELTLVCILLAELEQQDYMRPFLLALADDPTSPGEWQLFARLAAALGRLDVSVSLSKLALRGDLVMPEAGWPAPPSLSPDGAVERALVLAIIRQESEFDDSAISPAGARGLMQLMPATARQVAGSIRVVYDPDRLAHDRGYNVQLGTAHLGNLLETFGGSYVLSVAAYNAGGARVRTWIGEYGDPRNADVDPVDWIESIPFAETRNYVQRVMENLQVYRARLAGGKANVTLGETLGR
jgi:soluble lytic murein transglycosylase